MRALSNLLGAFFVTIQLRSLCRQDLHPKIVKS